jgi:hypothetical protein
MHGVWLDTRIGGHPRWVQTDDADLMQVPPDLLKCVCFVRATRPTGDMVSSAFFLSVPLGVANRDAVYAVTARHCIDASLDQNGDTTPFDSVLLRLNLVGGGSAEIETDQSRWILHPDCDVAILPIAPSRERFDYLYYPARGGATEQFLTASPALAESPMWKLGPGEEVLITGLLVYHPGESQIMPIVRVGNIAALPTEPVNLVTGPDVVSLVEVRSLGGLSGSPAFLHLGGVRVDEVGRTMSLRRESDDPDAPLSRGGANFLMGLVHGFYPTKENDPEGLVKGLNSGITAVVKIERILDLIDHPNQVEVRAAMKKKIKDQQGPTPASHQTEESEFDRFENLAQKLVNTPKPKPDEQPSETS